MSTDHPAAEATLSRNGSASHDTTSPRTSHTDAPKQPTIQYAPAPESVKVDIADRYGHYINGEFIQPRDKSAFFATLNPATEATLSLIAQGSEKDVDTAVAAARKALPKWQALPATERAKFLFRIARRIQERARELAVLETMDSGKPIKESRDVDIPLVAAHFFYHAGWADKLEYVSMGTPAFQAGRSSSDSRSNTRLGEPRYPQPVGVCGQIIPWNFPLLMCAWKLAPALACGNTIVLKPAETTSLTALRLAEIFHEVGLPEGVVNIVTGDGKTGAAIVNHPGIDKIAFTGSTDVGKKIAKALANTKKKLTLELGGKSPHIIFDDASIDQAVEGIIQGIYFNQGEVCCAGSRLLVQESILEEVKKKLELRMASLRVGDPMDKNTDVGAINSKSQLDRINYYLAEGQKEGAQLCSPTKSQLPSKGYWCKPCFFYDVQPSHIVAREEIFGPVLALMSFRTVDEAITKANNTPYGLAAGIWTSKGSKMFEVAGKLKAGVVWCNTYNRFDPTSPFGGYKESGFGREGGMQGLGAYLK
ncbi:MAG: aldehyde dehydrogenase family protein [Phycisphaerales bacterium]